MHQWEGSDPSVLLWIKMSCQLSLPCMSVSSTQQECSVGPFKDEKYESQMRQRGETEIYAAR